MRISGKYTFAASRQAVWDGLQDPAVIAACMRGCEGLEEIGPDHYRADITVGVASIKGRYSGTVAISEKEPLDSYRMTVNGGGPPGIIDASGLVALADDGTGTRLSFEGEVKATGPLASLGSRLIGAVAKMLIDQFMTCVSARLDGR